MANTGKKIVTTLKQVDTNSVPPNLPLGVTKPNVIGEDDYVAPTTDPDSCPVTYTLSCPVVVASPMAAGLRYEFSLPNSVINNPLVKIVRVQAMNAGVAGQTRDVVLPNVPAPNFFGGTLTGLLNTKAYSMRVTHIGDAGAVLAICEEPTTYTPL